MIRRSVYAAISFSWLVLVLAGSMACASPRNLETHGTDADAPPPGASTEGSPSASDPAVVASAAPATSTAGAPPELHPLRLDVDAEELDHHRTATFELPYAWLDHAKGTVLHFADRPGACNATLGRGAHELAFPLGGGPGGNHFASGKPFVAFARRAGGELSVEAAELTLEPFDDERGGSVRGSVRVDDSAALYSGSLRVTGGGTFVATICDAPRAPSIRAPASAPDEPLAGSIGSDPFHAQSALAWPIPMTSDVMIAVVDGRASCSDRADIERRAAVLVHMPRAFDRKLFGAPQPLHADVRDARGGLHALSESKAEAWGQIDASDGSDGEPGNVLHGRLAIASRAAPPPFVPVNVAGTFHATLCRDASGAR